KRVTVEGAGRDARHAFLRRWRGLALFAPSRAADHGPALLAGYDRPAVQARIHWPARRDTGNASPSDEGRWQGRPSTPLSTRMVGRLTSHRPCHFRWPARCLFISNMVTLSLPKTLRSLSSARISRRFSGFCRLCKRMYSHILLTTWPRGSGPEPTTAASSSDGCSGFCRAFILPGLAFFSRVLVGIDPLQLPCGAPRAARATRHSASFVQNPGSL